MLYRKFQEKILRGSGETVDFIGFCLFQILSPILWTIMPRHEMAEGHMEFNLSVCVPESCPGHNFTVLDRS